MFGRQKKIEDGESSKSTLSNSNMNNQHLQETQTQATIVIDAAEEDNSTPDFDSYSKTFANLIRYSEPHFTLGIYGEWGTGKTTLMKKIQKELLNHNDPQNQKIVPVWFNAWRYEREEHFATIALLRTIAYAIADHEKFKQVHNTIIRGLKIVGIDALRKISTDAIMTEKGWDKLETQLTEKMEFLNKIEKDTIYFDGMKNIKEMMDKIRKDDPKYRIVVFVDDLDRCSPTKALEVLESMKVFLDIEGFVYVIGLSIKTVAKLISFAYEATGVKGEDYIKKIIQIPFRIPPWNTTDLERLMGIVSDRLFPPYDELIMRNSDIISTGIEANPRELKRFINNLIVAGEVLNNPEERAWRFRDLSVLEAIKSRWNDIYELLVNDEHFRSAFQTWLNLSPDEKENVEEAVKNLNDEKKEAEAKKFLSPYQRGFQMDIKDFIKLIPSTEGPFDEFVSKHEVRNIIANISDWETYRRVAGATKEISAREIAEAQENPREIDESQENPREAIRKGGHVGTKTPEVLVQELFSRVNTDPAFRNKNWSEIMLKTVTDLKNLGDAIGSNERKWLFEKILEITNSNPTPNFNKEPDNTKLFNAVKELHDFIFKNRG